MSHAQQTPQDYEESFNEYCAQVKQAQDEYVARWPQHCRKCHGWGAFSWYENHGVPGPGEQLSEPCDGCTASEEHGPQRCPRCYTRTLAEDGSGNCAACGWTPQEGGCPQV